MPWFQVDDQFSFHPKTIQAGNGSVGLWTRAGSWSRLHGTGGHIPTAIARSMGTAAEIRGLVDAKLWIEAEGGFQFWEWDDRQRSKEKEDELRRARADAGRQGGKNSGASRRSRSKIEANASPEMEASAEANASEYSNQLLKQKRTPVLVPVPEVVALGGESLEPNGRANNHPPPLGCPKHPNGTSDPCTGCAEVRKAKLAADAEAAALAVARRQADTAAAADARRQAIDACGLCDDQGYVGTRVCSHDPDEADRRARHMAAIKAQLAAPKAAPGEPPDGEP